MIGTVCYIDLLGFSFLTANPDKGKYQKIIYRYIKNLHKYISQAIEKTNIRYCILSDSVFLYVEKDVDILLYALTRIFRNCISSGVLLRAGLAYGEYNFIETKIDSNNIFGVAVTKAVSLEKKGKGCRIFIDADLPSKSALINLDPKIFIPYINHVDYSAIDIFEWPLFYKDYCFRSNDIVSKHNIRKEIRELLYNNSRIIACLKYSPLFDWNAKSTDGKVQLKATIEYITKITNDTIQKTNQFELLPTEYTFDIIRREATVKNLQGTYKGIYNIEETIV
ncbi:hypothetical protein LQZ19_04445 [Treponema primitia]|uniref:hypothetical protein n=1 Tax=Treponema primitia TaxID=88058 RepID=UPI003980CE19